MQELIPKDISGIYQQISEEELAAEIIKERKTIEMEKWLYKGDSRL